MLDNKLIEIKVQNQLPKIVFRRGCTFKGVLGVTLSVSR